MSTLGDRDILRGLARQYLALCEGERNRGCIEDWRDLNNMKQTRPMIFCNLGLLGGEIAPHLPESRVSDESLRGVERWFQHQLWSAALGDDRAFMPWYEVRADLFSHPEGVWGVVPNRVRDGQSRGWRHLPVLTDMDDLDGLKATEHRVIDAHPTWAQTLEEIFGDILPVYINRSTMYPMWGGSDLSEAAGALFGLQELLFALYEAPERVHRFMAFTRDAVLANFRQGEAAGDWSTADSSYYLVPSHCDALPDPDPTSYGAPLKDLTFFAHSQEFDGVSPTMHEEFLLNYQMPIMKLFGRVTYGCCDTLDTKLDILNTIPNMTKVLSGPRSDPAHYPEKVGDRCVISWRPIGSFVSGEHFSEADQRKQLREGISKLQGCQFEIHMHEPMTVHHDVSRISDWVRIAREEAGCAA